MTSKKLLILIFALFGLIINAQKTKQKEYVFFLHNKFLETHALDEAHPQYGIPEYQSILKKLKTENSVIISEKKKAYTDPQLYAKKIITQIDSLHGKGIPFNRISVVGTSQGGYIAQYVSYFSKNPKLKFVIIGSSFKNDSMNLNKNFKLYGKILSITEKSDTDSELLSKQKRYSNSNIKYFKELVLNTGLSHGFLFKALDDWILPTKEWIYNN